MPTSEPHWAQVAPAQIPGLRGFTPLAVSVVAVVGLYLGREVLIPITLATPLIFALVPLVELFRRVLSAIRPITRWAQVAPADMPSLRSLATVAVSVIIVACLYLGREVLILITLVLPLSFVLARPSSLLRRGSVVPNGPPYIAPLTACARGQAL